MTIAFMKKFGYAFFEYFYQHIDKNAAQEEIQNVERFKEELIIMAFRTLTDYEKLFKLLEPRFGVMYTSGFSSLFYRLYWSMNSCVSFKNLKKVQNEFQAALKDLSQTKKAGYIISLQALVFNSNFMISNSFGKELMDSLVPENIVYSNLTVYENMAYFLSSVVVYSGIYIKNDKNARSSLFPDISKRVVHFLKHVKTQNKVTQISSLRSMFIPLMSQNLVIDEELYDVVEELLDSVINIGEGDAEGIEDMISGLVGIIQRFSSKFYGKKEYLISRLINAFTVTGQMEEENSGEHANYKKVKGNRGKIIMQWLAATIGSDLKNLEINHKIPILSIFSFLASTVTSKDESASGNMIEYVISRCSNNDLEWVVSEIKTRLEKIKKR